MPGRSLLLFRRAGSWRLGALLLVLLQSGSDLAAESSAPQVTCSVIVTTNYYTVTGATPHEISASMLQARPWKTSATFDAFTTWDTRWNYKSAMEDGEFLLESFEAQTKVVITLPRWIPPTNAAPWVKERWWKFATGLTLHEQGHLALARQATAELQRQISALKPFASARELRRVVNQTADQVIDKFREADRAYDRETNHGTKQGAVLIW